MASFTAEQVLEDNLIKQLISGKSQWNYRKDLNTEDKLWENLKEKLESNNKGVLKDIPLTEGEFKQVKNQLSFSSFYEAAKWLVGENGIAKVSVQREDASLGTIYLRVISRQDIAGGISSYEVINQYRSDKCSFEDPNRRFDVTLLINGLPMIHIELKNKSHPYMDAFRQIKNYIKEGKFRGIYSSVQMFVVSNGTDTRYIAAAKDTELNEKFLTRWVDEKNNPVNGYLEFAKDVLAIPMAHKMVTQYTVIDNEKKSLIVLRPYQIHAIEAVKEASSKGESGYVWHTTGSGKTLTSYKVARNLLQIPSIEKTIFIVDRVDLDQQTSSSFNSYAENDVVDIDETDNVTHLTKKLLSDDRTVIITTIQKLQYLMRRFSKKEGSREYDKLTSLKVTFVVDECHRAVSAICKKEIDEFFVKALWYGFTGTPILVENAKSEVGNLARTTEDLYGRKLHEYTVKEAIHDGAVLGFQVEYMSTFSKDELNDAVMSLKGSKDYSDIAEMDTFDKEKLLPSSIYDDERHMLEVIDTIINKSRAKLGFYNGIGRTYLTTTSIEKAQRYYDLFKRVKAGECSVKVSEKTKRKLPDFPKIAITYSISENEEDSFFNQDKMKEILRDYNEEYNTRFTLETIKGYNSNINDRLARKKEQYLPRSEQIDIVIVVDRLLTGFDAPCLSTLFIDRKPMQPHNLIQAFSRTNRIFDKGKKFGQIVTFQTPTIFEIAVKKAIFMYSNGGESTLMAPTWEESKSIFFSAIDDLKNIAFVPSAVDSLNSALLKKFVKAFQKFDKAFVSIQVYSEFNENQMGSVFPITFEEIEDYNGKYVNALEKLKEDRKEDEDVDIDIEYEIESVKVEEINYEYILKIIQIFMGNKKTTQKDREEIDKYIDDLRKSNLKLASIMKELWKNVQEKPEEYKDKNASEILENMIQEVLFKVVKDFSKKWYVGEEELLFVVNNYNTIKSRQVGEKELKDSANYELYKKEVENPISKLRFWKAVLTDFNEVMKEDILPLMRR